MSYKFKNVTAETLKAFISLRTPDPDKVYQMVLEKVQEGDYDFNSRWFYTREGVALAALTRYPTPRPIYSLRTVPDIDEQDTLRLLEFSEELSEESGPATLNYNLASAADISGTALEQGWTLEAHVQGFDTPLGERTDLKPDSAAKSFPLDHLKSEDFATFYKPIWEADVAEQELEPLKQEVTSFIEANTLGEVIYLYDDSKPVAVGVVDYEDVATMTLIGVLPEHRRQGWGARLHRHLMWVAKQHADLYRGQTDVGNAAMLRLFKKNDCVRVAEVWQLIAPESSG